MPRSRLSDLERLQLSRRTLLRSLWLAGLGAFALIAPGCDLFGGDDDDDDDDDNGDDDDDNDNGDDDDN